ncbi:MAG: hypothetical protein A3H96_06010 [Acidobacteria bacterium RIFCSPLOWO2_02_FULL_67_36]|nr:MAG: hypothetical protein A3H96_06010 [Acidobacteria bacterium RIFCSPLOWO2_02_FULL_67_36]OFW20190.1 MAG: hypothetical protein A3G21_26320 [Acidobacteria bacterium RIFCSPLOWO2_12_FULL_66_21]
MPILHDLQQISLFALTSLAVCVLPLLMAICYVFRPSEANLALMRPLSLAAIFAGLSGVFSGLTIILRGLAATPPSNTPWGSVAAGMSEALIPAFVGFSCLTGAWLLVALGMRRTG